jgi:hypothetical protein
MKRQTARKSTGWRGHIKTLVESRLPGGRFLINPQVIHGFFGQVGQHGVLVYKLKKTEENGSNCAVTIHGCRSATIEEAFNTVNQSKEPLDRLWYYLADQKYILYVEGVHACCIDYGHFKGADTTIVEFIHADKLGLNFLTRLDDLQFLIREAQRLMDYSHKQHQRTAAVVENFVAEATTERPSKIAATAENKIFEASKCCQLCKKISEQDLIKCSRCKSVYYCDRACQGKDLPKHRADCVELGIKPINE